MRKMRAIMAIIDGEVVTPEVVEEAKEVATEAETTAVEVEMAKTVGMTVVTKEVTRNVAPEARVEILDNQETMKKITR
jgi:isocitrate/isopropylmalate dehydrogenase